jgi:hypothetical protein
MWLMGNSRVIVNVAGGSPILGLLKICFAMLVKVAHVSQVQHHHADYQGMHREIKLMVYNLAYEC